MGKAGRPTLALPHARSASCFIPKSRTQTFRLRIQGNPDGLIFIYTVTLKTVPMIGHPEEIDQPHHGKMLKN